MNKPILWHNQSCSKSRATNELLEDYGIDIDIINYLEVTPSKDEIKEVLKMIGITPRELMRTKEDIYIELNLKDENDDEILIEAMVNNPILIERPIVIHNGKAAIGRPIGNIIKLFS